MAGCTIRAVIPKKLFGLPSSPQRHERRSKAAKRAAVTLAKRREKQVYTVGRRLLQSEGIGPAMNCVICGRRLSEAPSIERSVGSECWQGVLSKIEQLAGPSTCDRLEAHAGVGAGQ